jgi:hypothetical protein
MRALGGEVVATENLRGCTDMKHERLGGKMVA